MPAKQRLGADDLLPPIEVRISALQIGRLRMELRQNERNQADIVWSTHLRFTQRVASKFPSP